MTFTRCGNRRADRCESCSRLYAADTFQLIRAGIAGGKTVPQAVADNPLVFATLTALLRPGARHPPQRWPVPAPPRHRAPLPPRTPPRA